MYTKAHTDSNHDVLISSSSGHKTHAYHHRFFLKIVLMTVMALSSSASINAEDKTQLATHPSSIKTIAITQIVTHPSADQTRLGVVEGLRQSGYREGENLKIIYENPQGNMSIAMQIAQKFASLKPDVLVPITTPSTQTVMSAAQHTGIPIVFASVTDPVNANVVKSLKKPGGMITGATDYPPIEATLESIKSVNRLIKKIGMIYNPGEINSTKMVELYQKEAQQQGFELLVQTAINTSDIQQAALTLVDKVDALLISLDNTALSSMASIIKVANAKNKPVFSNDPDSVSQGVLMGVSNTQYDAGVLAGQIIARVLNGENPGDIDVAAPESPKIILNAEAAKKLDITFAPELVKKAVNMSQESLQ